VQADVVLAIRISQYIMEVSTSNIDRVTACADLGFPWLFLISRREFLEVTSTWAMPDPLKLLTLPTYLRYLVTSSDAMLDNFCR